MAKFVSAETRKKISESLKNSKDHFPHRFQVGCRVALGTKWTEERRLKTVASLKKNEAKAYRFERGHSLNNGRTMSEDTKKKMSLAKLGKKKSDAVKHRIALAKIGEKNPQWKGGIKMDRFGYRHIRKPTHPRQVNGYIPEHRFIMEDHIGRFLSSEEVVHHINGIKNDNRIENLLLFKNNKEHMAHHRALKELFSL